MLHVEAKESSWSNFIDIPRFLPLFILFQYKHLKDYALTTMKTILYLQNTYQFFSRNKVNVEIYKFYDRGGFQAWYFIE